MCLPACAQIFLVRDTANSPFVNHKGSDVNSDWLTDQWDERSVLGHAQFHKGRMKGNDPEIDTAQTQKRFDGRLALLENIRTTLIDIVSRTISRSIAKHVHGYINLRQENLSEIDLSQLSAL